VAWSTSYIVPSTLVAGLTGTSMNLGSGASNVYCALFGTSTAPNVDGDPQYYGDSIWTSGNECTGTNWAAGGVALSLTGNGLTHQTGGFMEFQAGNFSVANTTISTGVYGCLLYFHGMSPNPLAICAVYFGGSGYTTSGTPFGITWPVGGIWTIELQP
jgi:hypothetical protein